MAGRLDEALAFHESALRLRAQRQQVLASNIANADTPNYQARDLDFAASMRQALASAEPASPGLARTSPGHLGVSAGSGLADTKPRAPLQNSRDGNTVDLDVERSAFAENALRYEADVTQMLGAIKDLLAVVRG